MPEPEQDGTKYTGVLAQEIDTWVARTLQSYFESSPRATTTQSKQIHDPTVGTIGVAPHELYVLDSPLFQRLRYVRQLGVGHVLFPTSAYSRFEHSLGAMHKASTMFDALVAAQRETGSPIYSETEFAWRRGVVRLAALLHDIGHCVFSHVSERFYEQYAELNSAREFYRRRYQSRVSPSESITLLILQSGAFRELLDRSGATMSIGIELDKMIRLIRACIAGSKVTVRPDSFMAELINGPVDCDKLDYLARDAFSAGVPIALDSGRLISKLRLATIESDEGQPYISLAIVMSGTRALDELLVSRLFLFDKFYFHPKVMAAEEAVRSGLRAMARAVPSFLNPVTLLDDGDDELLHLRSEDVEARYGVTRTNTDVVRAIELFGRVRNHDLPKRAFAFAVRFMAKVPSLIVKYEYQDNFDEAASVNEVEFKQLGRNLEDPVWLERFTGRLNELAREIGVESDAYIAHQVAERVTKATHLPVVMAGGVVAQHPPFLFKAHEWTEAYALNRATSYVFAYSDLEKVHLAAERLFLLERGMPHFAPSCASIAKLSEDRLQRERENLPLEWTDHRLRQDYLSTQDATRRVAALRDKFATFLNAFDRRIASRLIEAWLYQFPTADLQESAICLLEHLKYYEKSDILDGFKVLIGNHSELKSALWIPFVAQTDPGKSADVLVADVRPLDVFCRKIGELDVSTIEKFEHVVFFDDAINTGTQALTLLRSWFGAEADGTDVLSDRDEPLSEDVRDALRKAKIHFVVFAKHHQGESHLRNGVRDLALGTVEVLSVVDSASLEHTLSGLMCSTEKSKALLIEYMKQQGEQLLARRAHAKGWPPEQQAKFALGFGELHLTIAFHHSISTALPAVLWEHLDGPTKYWLPLFPRDREAVRKALTTPDVQTPPDELPLYPD